MTVEEINNNIKLGIFSKDILDDICKYDSINNNYIIKDIESSKLINCINTKCKINYGGDKYENRNL